MGRHAHGVYRVNRQDLIAVADGVRDRVRCISDTEDDGLLNSETGGQSSSPSGNRSGKECGNRSVRGRPRLSSR